MAPSDDVIPNPPEAPVRRASDHAEPAAGTGVQDRPAPGKVDHLQPFRVLLHNDDVNDMEYVVETLCDLTPLPTQRAEAVMMEAHRTGVALVLMTHRERAELYVDQFRSKKLTATMEPGE
jgi:ATP-dependent Clp protease adaptor protein ClpS